MQALASGLAMAPVDDGLAQSKVHAAVWPHLDVQRPVGQDRPPALVPRSNERLSGEMIHDSGSASPAIHPLPNYAPMVRAAAASIARAANTGVPITTTRSAGTASPASFAPVTTRWQQHETGGSSDLAVHLVGVERSSQRVHEHIRPAIGHIQSRIATMARASLAPTKTAVPAGAAQTVSRAPRSNGMTDSMPASQSSAVFDERHLDRLISDQLERIAMRPSAGMTGYDPRVSPSYPGAPSDA